jgi:predicted phosphodiesterase
VTDSEPTAGKWRGRVLGALLLLGVFCTVTLATAWASLRFEAREVVIGSQSTIVRPTFDRHATVDLGPLLPRLRVPLEGWSPLGFHIDVGPSVGQATSVEAVIQQNTVIASQPAGELATLRATVRSMLLHAFVRGLGAGVLVTLSTVAVWRLVGPARRAELRARVRQLLRERRRRPALAAGAVVLVAALAMTALVVPPGGDGLATEEEWVRAVDLVPSAALTGRLADIEVSQGPATTGSLALIRSAISTYNTSVTFYGELEEAVPTDGFRVPEEGETVALLVADRHDNIGMDPVARAIGDAGGATVLISAGDETSTGSSWEAFSVSSLADAFSGYDVVAVAANHDHGSTVLDGYQDAGFTVLSGEPVEVAGIRFLGDSDPRSSGLTAVYTPGDETVPEQAERLAAVACEDGDVSTVVVHSPSSGAAAAESGCVDLVLSGHLHRQVGPENIASQERSTTVYTNGTTGGAAFAFALGSKLRREAQVTLVTFADGRPVGLQPVGITPGGDVVPADYVELPLAGTTAREDTP